jgi:ketol-acid reductoisomerase
MLSKVSPNCAGRGIRRFNTKVFDKTTITLADRTENIVVGGRDKFHLLPQAFQGIKQIGVLGWSSQGPAQAMNLRDSLEGTGIKVSVGLREGSASMDKAAAAGFSRDDGTLGEMYDVASKSDMTLLLISDAAQAATYPKLFQHLKKGSTLGLSHGFLLGILNNRGEKFPEGIDAVAVCPKGMGPSVRRLYEQGKSVNGAGINCSFAVEQNATGLAVERALGWGVGIGAPFIFETTMKDEYVSDIFGERSVLLGAIHGIVEFLFRHFVANGVSKEEAFKRTAESITGPITRMVSHSGLLSVYDSFSGAQKKEFEVAYSAAYHPLMEVLMEIYDDVKSGRELDSVIDAVARHDKYPMTTIDDTETWRVGEQVRAARTDAARPVCPTTAGVYLACMQAQADLLIANGHSYSEVANESIIEAVDSLNPYVDFRGIAYMIDNCSIVARLGARKWAPRFDYLLMQQAGPKLEKGEVDERLITAFKENKLHQIMSVCAALRPSVDISPVVGQHGVRDS